MVDPKSIWKLGDMLLGSKEKSVNDVPANVTRVDDDGTVWVSVYDSEMPVKGVVGSSVSAGDRVMVSIAGNVVSLGGNDTDPPVGGNEYRKTVTIIGADAAEARKGVAAAEKAASEAAEIASAVGQHFWQRDEDAQHDGAGTGAFVTDETQEGFLRAAADGFPDLSDEHPHHNLLMNSLGILIRSALRNLVSISRSAIAFFDGSGNAAANVVARFGSDGAQIGANEKTHAVIDYHSMRLVDKDGSKYFHVSDLRDESGYASVTYTKLYWESDGYTGGGPYYLYSLPYDVHSITSVSVSYKAMKPSTEVVDYGTVHPQTTYTETSITIQQHEYPSEWDSSTYRKMILINVLYTTDSGDAKAFTFGWREPLSDVGGYSFVAGFNCKATGRLSHAEGNACTSSGMASHAEGDFNTASGGGSHVEGSNNEATGESSHSEGMSTKSSGRYSHAEGCGDAVFLSGGDFLSIPNEASGRGAHVEGHMVTAAGDYAHAQNDGTCASSESQTAIGKWNEEDTSDTYALIIGNGTVDNRSNALTVDWSGNVESEGDVSARSGATTHKLSEKANSGGSTKTLKQVEDSIFYVTGFTEVTQTNMSVNVGSGNIVNSHLYYRISNDKKWMYAYGMIAVNNATAINNKIVVKMDTNTGVRALTGVDCGIVTRHSGVSAFESCLLIVYPTYITVENRNYTGSVGGTGGIRFMIFGTLIPLR